MQILIHNGKTYNETLAILRYLGKQFGYYPETHTEAWHADAITDFSHGLLFPIYSIFRFKKDFSETGQ